MSKELVELVQQGYDAWNSGDRGWVLEHMAEDIRWMTPPDDPDPGTYEGYAGVEQYWAQWRAAVGQLNFEVEEILDAGRAVVVVAGGRGEASTAACRSPTGSSRSSTSTTTGSASRCTSTTTATRR